MREIGSELTLEERDAFVMAARRLLGVRFRHQGRDEKGVDCAGLVIYAFNSIGRPPYDAGVYSREPRGNRLAAMIRRNLGEPYWTRADGGRPQMRQGDVALMKFVGDPSHLGIVTDYPDGGFALLHSFATIKKVTEHRIDDAWYNKNIVAVYRP